MTDQPGHDGACCESCLEDVAEFGFEYAIYDDDWNILCCCRAITDEDE